MNIKIGNEFEVINEVTVPIMPPVMFGRLSTGKTYEVNSIIGNEIELIEVSKHVRQHIKIKEEQLLEEIDNGSVKLV